MIARLQQSYIGTEYIFLPRYFPIRNDRAPHYGGGGGD